MGRGASTPPVASHMLSGSWGGLGACVPCVTYCFVVHGLKPRGNFNQGDTCVEPAQGSKTGCDLEQNDHTCLCDATATTTATTTIPDCGAGKYFIEGTGKCLGCTTCGEAFYRTGECSGTTDGYTCTSRPTCSSGEYLKGATVTSPGTCTACSNSNCSPPPSICSAASTDIFAKVDQHTIMCTALQVSTLSSGTGCDIAMNHNFKGMGTCTDFCDQLGLECKDGW